MVEWPTGHGSETERFAQFFLFADGDLCDMRSFMNIL